MLIESLVYAVYGMAPVCKYCGNPVKDITNEGLQCNLCDKFVHLNCLKRGSTPGGFRGDVFYIFTCLECNSINESELFIRQDMRWFEIVCLVFYNINIQSHALSKKGYFQWKIHIATFINQHWKTLLMNGVRQRKNWLGTIAGILSGQSPHFFTNGAPVIGENGWWNLTFPKLTPNVLSKLQSEFADIKIDLKNSGLLKPDIEIITDLVNSKNFDSEFTQPIFNMVQVEINKSVPLIIEEDIQLKENGQPKRFKAIQVEYVTNDTDESSFGIDVNVNALTTNRTPFQDPLCHYNTCLSNYIITKHLNLETKLMGGLREEIFLSPYSNLFLKPYIYRDTREKSPTWLKLMTQILLRTNINKKDYILPPRRSIDYVYVQPTHIPAINSLSQQFFWPGIDLSESLQYPDFSCVALYKRLVIGFAFIVPDVQYHENYISFIFVRPEWRNVGIGKFMIYHLIQTSIGKDVTLHVAINNSALFLYQKFGFKTERIELNFYDKYLPKDSYESKHAFFCRLER